MVRYHLKSTFATFQCIDAMHFDLHQIIKEILDSLKTMINNWRIFRFYELHDRNSNPSLIISEVHICFFLLMLKRNNKFSWMAILNYILFFICLATSITMHFMRQTTECDAMNNSVDLQFLHFQHTHKIFLYFQ